MLFDFISFNTLQTARVKCAHQVIDDMIQMLSVAENGDEIQMYIWRYDLEDFLNIILDRLDYLTVHDIEEDDDDIIMITITYGAELFVENAHAMDGSFKLPSNYINYVDGDLPFVAVDELSESESPILAFNYDVVTC